MCLYSHVIFVIIVHVYGWHGRGHEHIVAGWDKQFNCLSIFILHWGAPSICGLHGNAASAYSRHEVGKSQTKTVKRQPTWRWVYGDFSFFGPNWLLKSRIWRIRLISIEILGFKFFDKFVPISYAEANIFGSFWCIFVHYADESPYSPHISDFRTMALSPQSSLLAAWAAQSKRITWCSCDHVTYNYRKCKYHEHCQLPIRSACAYAEPRWSNSHITSYIT